MCVVKKLLNKATDQCYHTFDMLIKSCRFDFIASGAHISINCNVNMRKIALGFVHHNVLYFSLLPNFPYMVFYS